MKTPAWFAPSLVRDRVIRWDRGMQGDGMDATACARVAVRGGTASAEGPGGWVGGERPTAALQ
ncbi:hypothetical protein Scani_40710 [Streptomyces caniferus]|uniref:Uncharacterized protein n=1 Tax=Streptomyces caniferus TaxID=285557 RepID=A0A640S8I0_9ACTN|nr:hypothetical protein Scani_40710 [Streptomyces caniferus]